MSLYSGLDISEKVTHVHVADRDGVNYGDSCNNP